MKTIKGIVTSVKRNKTVTVLVTRKWQHPLYKKYIKRTKRYACHVDGLDLKEGERVIIKEVKPVSKTKRFQVMTKLQAAKKLSVKKAGIEKAEKPKQKKVKEKK
ncbi:MAG: 30S ribosomal protein S17 [Candidatus Woesebacteria bacterium]|jgi:small subunit ribosomal protein S17